MVLAFYKRAQRLVAGSEPAARPRKIAESRLYFPLGRDRTRPKLPCGWWHHSQNCIRIGHGQASL